MKNADQQLWIILLIVFIGFLGTSIAYPIFPPLFLYSTPDSLVPVNWSTAMRSIFLGIALAAYPLGQFIGSPIIGGCSDQYPRKRVLMISLTGSAAGYLLSAVALEFNGLWTLIISRFITGVFEGNFAIVRAMATDLKGISKYKSLGRINTMASLGYIIGPILGGVLSDDEITPLFSYAFPFYFAMLFSFAAVILSWYKLTDTNQPEVITRISFWQRFNLIAQFRNLIQHNVTLKYLLIISTVFTFGVDIFYEFGPVYLTGLWQITPAGIAVYNAALSVTLAFGSGWLPHLLSRYHSVERVITAGMLSTAIILLLMVVFKQPLFILLLWGLAGLTIAATNTNMVIEISDAADKTIQGEAMGAQLSLRMLGDAIICLCGGFLIISSVVVPMAISGLVALIAALLFAKQFLRR